MSEHQRQGDEVDPQLFVVLEGLQDVWTTYFTAPVGTEEEVCEGLCDVLATHMVGTREQFRNFCMLARNNVEDLMHLEARVSEWKDLT